MLWLLGKLSGGPESISRKKLVLAACACARLSLKYVKKGEERPRIAIETAEAWARGKGPTLAEIRNAAYASFSSFAYAPGHAALTSAEPARAVHACYAHAVAVAGDYGAGDYDIAARMRIFARCANIVRKHYPKPPRLK